MKQGMTKIAGLWKNTNKQGQEYLSGNFTYGTKLLVFPNGYKRGDKEPDYIVYLAETEKKQDQAAPASADDLPF